MPLELYILECRFFLYIICQDTLLCKISRDGGSVGRLSAHPPPPREVMHSKVSWPYIYRYIYQSSRSMCWSYYQNSSYLRNRISDQCYIHISMYKQYQLQQQNHAHACHYEYNMILIDATICMWHKYINIRYYTMHNIKSNRTQKDYKLRLSH